MAALLGKLLTAIKMNVFFGNHVAAITPQEEEKELHPSLRKKRRKKSKLSRIQLRGSRVSWVQGGEVPVVNRREFSNQGSGTMLWSKAERRQVGPGMCQVGGCPCRGWSRLAAWKSRMGLWPTMCWAGIPGPLLWATALQVHQVLDVPSLTPVAEFAGDKAHGGAIDDLWRGGGRGTKFRWLLWTGLIVVTWKIGWTLTEG